VVSSVSNNYGNYYYDGNNVYTRQDPDKARAGVILAGVATAAIAKLLPSFSNPFFKQVAKEHANNHLYKDAFMQSINNSGLKEKGLNFVNLTSSEKYKDIAAGFNACYMPGSKSIMLNAEKATISGFHELGHAMNHLKSKTGKLLQKCRKPGYAIVGLMGWMALNVRNKPKGAERNFEEVIEDNAGKIAFCAMLPTVIEEAMASYKGVKLAKEAGLAEPLVKNLKKLYGKALLSYLGYATISGLSVFVASKIMETFTRPKKVEPQDWHNTY